MEIISIGENASKLSLELTRDGSTAVPMLCDSAESKSVSSMLKVCSSVLEFCSEGKWELAVLGRGVFNRPIQDHLLAGIMNIPPLSLGEWDDVLFRLTIPEDETFLAAVCFICLSADWELVGRSHDLMKALSIDMDQKVVGLVCS